MKIQLRVKPEIANHVARRRSLIYVYVAPEPSRCRPSAEVAVPAAAAPARVASTLQLVQTPKTASEK